MTDLTTITDPFGQLPRATQMELLAAHYLDHRVIQVQMTMRNKFEDIPDPNWFGGTVYRARPDGVTEALTLDSINWDQVAPEIKAFARDSDGSANAFDETPCIWPDHDHWTISGDGRFPARIFASYRPGTCDWKDSLVLRPVA